MGTQEFHKAGETGEAHQGAFGKTSLRNKKEVTGRLS